tara:strand:+ start:288 stop:596 length:309 start_codon:yes stop_codon:yes gene_type:complete
MKKFLIIFIIFLLVLSTAFIKNSTKKIEENIFMVEENIRSLKKELANSKLEFEYLSSTEKLLEFYNLYYDDQLFQKKIEEIKYISKENNKLIIESLSFVNEE